MFDRNRFDKSLGLWEDPWDFGHFLLILCEHYRERLLYHAANRERAQDAGGQAARQMPGVYGQRAGGAERAKYGGGLAQIRSEAAKQVGDLYGKGGYGGAEAGYGGRAGGYQARQPQHSHQSHQSPYRRKYNEVLAARQLQGAEENYRAHYYYRQQQQAGNRQPAYQPAPPRYQAKQYGGQGGQYGQGAPPRRNYQVQHHDYNQPRASYQAQQEARQWR